MDWQPEMIFQNFADFGLFGVALLWFFSPGPNEIFDRAKARAMDAYAKNRAKKWRFIFQAVFCPWCTAIILALFGSVFTGSFWTAIAITEACATATILRRD